MICYLPSVNTPIITSFFFFNDTATTEIYTLSLHDALPIFAAWKNCCRCNRSETRSRPRSEEHTSELQSRVDIVCRLLLEKKKKKYCHMLLNKKKQYRKLTKVYIKSS